jgi:hypothetical protein
VWGGRNGVGDSVDDWCVQHHQTIIVKWLSVPLRPLALGVGEGTNRLRWHSPHQTRRCRSHPFLPVLLFPSLARVFLSICRHTHPRRE